MTISPIFLHVKQSWERPGATVKIWRRASQPIPSCKRIHKYADKQTHKQNYYIRCLDNSQNYSPREFPVTVKDLCRERFDGFQVEVEVEVKVVEIFAVDQQVQHVVALSTDLQTHLDPVQRRCLEELGRLERPKQIPAAITRTDLVNNITGILNVPLDTYRVILETSLY